MFPTHACKEDLLPDTNTDTRGKTRKNVEHRAGLGLVQTVFPNRELYRRRCGRSVGLEHHTMGDRVGNIGMTVGRTDIKY